MIKTVTLSTTSSQGSTLNYGALKSLIAEAEAEKDRLGGIVHASVEIRQVHDRQTETTLSIVLRTDAA